MLKHTHLSRACSAVLSGAIALAPAYASDDCTEDAMVVFDGSGSMSEMGFNMLGEPRIFEARRAVRTALPQVAPLRNIGLIVYGPPPHSRSEASSNDSCQNIDVRFPPIPDAADRIISEVEALQPRGDTALTEAVWRAAGVLGYPAQRATIVLVTDGKETCGGAPCRLAEQFAKEAPGLTVHVIGYKIRGDHFTLDGPGGRPGFPGGTVTARCFADYTYGQYVNAETVDDLVAALQTTLGCPQIMQTRPAASEQKPG